MSSSSVSDTEVSSSDSDTEVSSSDSDAEVSSSDFDVEVSFTADELATVEDFLNVFLYRFLLAIS